MFGKQRDISLCENCENLQFLAVRGRKKLEKLT